MSLYSFTGPVRSLRPSMYAAGSALEQEGDDHDRDDPSDDDDDDDDSSDDDDPDPLGDESYSASQKRINDIQHVGESAAEMKKFVRRMQVKWRTQYK